MRRREFIRQSAAAAAGAAAGIAMPAQAQPAGNDAGVKWSKAPCRFCGTGCGVTVAVKDNRVIATQGDPQAEVNKGLNCIKGYYLSKIMYGEDRLTTPLLRMKDGKYAKEGEFERVSWDTAFDVMAEQFKRVLKEKGPTAVGMFGSGQWTVWEGYAGLKLMKAGFRSNNLDPNARHCMASAAVGFMRTFGADEPMGCYDDIEAADAFVLWGSNMAEMHPILWTRVTDRRLSAPNVKVAVLSTFEHRSYELADIELTFTPQTDLAILNYIAHHIISSGRVNKEFVEKHTTFLLGNPDIGYGLQAGASAAEGREERRRRRRLQADDLRRVRQVRLDLRPRLHRQAQRRAQEPPAGARRAVRRPEGQGDVVLDHGVQPAHARCLVQQHGLQHPPAHRQDRDARQQPVLADGAAFGVRHGARSRHVRPSPAGRHGGDQSQAPRARRGNLEAAARHHPRRAGLPRGAAEPDAQGRQAQRLLGDGQQQHAGGVRT